jgi:Holliday junction DNA helicase RuvA
MIAHLSGTLLSKEPNQVIVDVGGVGYDVTIPLST